MKSIINFFLKDSKFNSDIENFNAKALLLFIFTLFSLLFVFVIFSITSNNFHTIYTQFFYVTIGIISLYLIKKGKYKFVGNTLSVILVLTEINSMIFNFSDGATFSFFIDEFYVLIIFLFFSAMFAEKYILILNTILIITSTLISYNITKDNFPQEYSSEFYFGMGIYIITVISIFIFGYLYTHTIVKAIKEISEKAKDTFQKNIQLADKKILLENKQFELSEAVKKSEENDKLKSVFLANMSHEIRTPLNAILGFTELLKSNKLNKKQAEYIEIIRNSGTHLLELIDDIIDISKLASTQLKPEETTCNINNLLTEVLSFLELYLKKENKQHLKLDKSFGLNDTEAEILTDCKRLRQILVNLISNSIKFTEDGSISVSYKLQNKNELIFCIKDTGIGINKNQIPIIFDSFRQADESTTRQYGGTGLGLSISKACAELLGGKIWVESVIEKGSEFYFTIPYKQYLKTSKK